MLFSEVYSSIVCISKVYSCIVFPNLTDNCRVSQYTERVNNYTDHTVFLSVANTVVFLYNSGDEIQHSLSNMYLGFLHVLLWLDISFLFLTEYYFPCMDVPSVFISPPIEGYLGASKF